MRDSVLQCIVRVASPIPLLSGTIMEIIILSYLLKSLQKMQKLLTNVELSHYQNEIRSMRTILAIKNAQLNKEKYLI